MIRCLDPGFQMLSTSYTFGYTLSVCTLSLWGWLIAHGAPLAPQSKKGMEAGCQWSSDGTEHQHSVLGPAGCVATPSYGRRATLQASNKHIFGNFQVSESSNRELLGQHYCLGCTFQVKSHVTTNS